MKILLAVFALVGGLLVYRLVDLQAEQAARLGPTATSPAVLERVAFQPIPAARGRILARGRGGQGVVELVANEPCFELAVYYPVMDPDDWWISSQYRRIKKQIRASAKNPKLVVPGEEMAFALQQQINKFWQGLSKATGVPVDELLDNSKNVVWSVRKFIERYQQTHEEFSELAEQRMFYPVLGDLDERQALDVRDKLAAEKLGDSPWVVVRPSVRRVYRRGRTLCHLLGRTRLIPGNPSNSKSSLKASDNDSLPGELYGVEGFERIFDPQLRGTRGWLKLGRTPQVETPPENGQDITLTVDIELQEYVQKRLQKQVDNLTYATGGAAIVMDARSNELLAMASVPAFDPAEYVKRFSELKNDVKHQPLFNRALDGAYPPGSIVKPLVGAWAIARGKVSSGMTFDCVGFLSPKLKAFNCWLPQGHGPVDFVSAVAHSCDVYFYHVGEIVTAEGMSNLYQHLGFGEPVPLGVLDECSDGVPNRRGHVPKPEELIKRGYGMTEGEARNLAIGQGTLLVTPLQAALMAKSVITGRVQPPKILVDEPDPPGKPLDIGASILRLAREGMRRVVNDRNATAYNVAYTPDTVLAGKTGSATVQPKVIEWEVKYKDPVTQQTIQTTVSDLSAYLENPPVAREQLNWRATQFFPTLREEDRTDSAGREKHLAHGWFMGFAPFNKPRIVVLVFIEYGIAGGSGAGPVFKDIMLECKQLGYLN